MAGFSYRQRQLSAENAAIRFLALHDELTGLPNRKQFEEFMTETFANLEQSGHKAALFVLDLDSFKAVNDTLGHPVGDGLLKACAKRLNGSLRGGDLLARLSGDEFVIVVPRVTDPSMLAPLAERVLNLLSTPFRVEGHELQIGCSIGLAVAPDNGADTAALMRNADFALYRAKSEGRRTWRFFDPKMAEDPREPPHARGRAPDRAGKGSLPAPLPTADQSRDRADDRLRGDAALASAGEGPGAGRRICFDRRGNRPRRADRRVGDPSGGARLRADPAGAAGRHQPFGDAAEARRRRRLHPGNAEEPQNPAQPFRDRDQRDDSSAATKRPPSRGWKRSATPACTS